jgi:hypothetical protein
MRTLVEVDPGEGGPWWRLKRGEIAAVDLEEGEEGRSQGWRIDR